MIIQYETDGKVLCVKPLILSVPSQIHVSLICTKLNTPKIDSLRQFK